MNNAIQEAIWFGAKWWLRHSNTTAPWWSLPAWNHVSGQGQCLNIIFFLLISWIKFTCVRVGCVQELFSGIRVQIRVGESLGNEST